MKARVVQNHAFVLASLCDLLPTPTRAPAGLRSAVSRAWSGVRYRVWPHTFVSPSAESRRAVVSYWRKYVHEVLVYRLGGLSLPRKSAVRLTDHPDVTLDVYRGHKTTIQQQQPEHPSNLLSSISPADL